MQESAHQGQTFCLAATLDLLDPLRKQFRVFLERAGVGVLEVEHWITIFTEAVVNAVIHGSRCDPSKSIRVSWAVDSSGVTLDVEDSGSGPPYEKTKHTELPRDPYSTQGRGLFIIEEFCDSVKHWRSEQGYRLSIRCRHKNVNPELASDPVLDQALEEITLCYESLAAFYRLGDTLIESRGVDDFFNQSMPDLERLVHADSIQFFVGEGLHQSLLDAFKGVPFYVGTICSECRCKGVAENGVEYIWEHPEEIKSDPCFEKYGCGIMYPVKARGEVFGILALARHTSDPHFNAAELNTIRTFGDLSGIALAHANNAITREREQRAMQEVAIAAQLQDTLFPVPHLDGASSREAFFAERRSAREVGGDYLDACVTANGGRLFVAADVMGKGVSAAFFASMLRTALHINLEKSDSLLDHMALLNQVLCSQVGDLTLFATCSLIYISEDFTRLDVLNAGHCPILILNDGVIHEVKASGPPLGFFDKTDCVVESFKLGKEAGVIVVTDGLFEWEHEGSIWGWNAFLNYVKPEHFYKPHVLWDSLRALIESESEERMDDQALLSWALKR